MALIAQAFRDGGPFMYPILATSVFALAIIRLIGELANANTSDRFWITVDHLLQPLVHGTVVRLFSGRIMSYRTALVLFSALDLVAFVAGSFLIRWLVNLLFRLPF